MPSLKSSHPRPWETPPKSGCGFISAGRRMPSWVCGVRVCVPSENCITGGEIQGERATWPSSEKGTGKRSGPLRALLPPSRGRAPSSTVRHILREAACVWQAKESKLPPRDQRAPGKRKDTFEQDQPSEYPGPANQLPALSGKLRPHEKKAKVSISLWGDACRRGKLPMSGSPRKNCCSHYHGQNEVESLLQCLIVPKSH